MAGAAPRGGLLQGHPDAYEGLILDPDSLPSTADQFIAAMDASLLDWRQVRAEAPCPPACARAWRRAARHCAPCHCPPQKGYRGIWLKLPTSHAHLVGHAVDRGFEFHHAEQVGLWHGSVARVCAFRNRASTVSCLGCCLVRC